MKISIKLAVIACSIVTLLSLGWQHWRSSKSEPLPPQITVAGTSNILRGQYYAASIPPTSIDSYQSADFRLWIPANIPTLRGLIIKQHGCGDDAAATALAHANDLQWQALALKHQFALLGTKFLTGKQPCESWALTNYGSGSALIKALELLGTQSKHLELNRVPWALWGHSGGADWIIQLLQQYPDRTIAAIAARGGGFTLLGTNPTLANIPVLFALGAKDKVLVNETQTLPTQAFQRYRKLAAPWTLAVEANTGHETNDTRMLAIPYLDAILTQRLPLDGKDLRPIDRSQGWLGNIVTYKITPANQFEGNQLESSWLPNEETARKWHEYVTTGRIYPTQKPTVPNEVKATIVEQKKVLLTWNFKPDLENGLPSFRIYRNNSLLATLQGQSHNFGDVTNIPNVELKFRDEAAAISNTYSIAAFNTLGESRSNPIKPIQNE